MEVIMPVYKRYLENRLLLVYSDIAQTLEAFAVANRNK